VSTRGINTSEDLLSIVMHRMEFNRPGIRILENGMTLEKEAATPFVSLVVVLVIPLESAVSRLDCRSLLVMSL